MSGPLAPWLTGWTVLVMVLPLLALVLSFAQWDAHVQGQLAGMWQTTLPATVGVSLGLCVVVGVAVLLLGTVTACVIGLYDFTGRAVWRWATLLPLAMPAYVCAYAYTDFFQFSGPVQVWVRSTLGLSGAVLPDIRGFWGAAFLFSITLYPYVHLLVRTAVMERMGHLLEVAQMLGAGSRMRLVRVVLPLARPAMVAGTALVLMETLADYGVGSFFGIQTFTTGIYKAWLAMDAPVLAALLALLLMVFVALLLWAERKAQRRLRFASRRMGAVQSAEGSRQRLTGGRAALANLVCLLPVLLGFGLPVLILLRSLWLGWDANDDDGRALVDGARFAAWAWNSFKLGAMGALLACAVALVLGFMLRTSRSVWVRTGVQVASLGYALPGAVIVVGMLLPGMVLRHLYPDLTVSSVLTTTVLGLMWAYMVRFSSVALQSVQSGYTRIPVSMDESARTLGLGLGRVLTDIHMPLLRGSLMSAVLLVFVDVMKELPATLVLRPFNHDTLAVMAYQLARDERLAEAAVPSLALVAVGLVPVIMLSRAMDKRGN